MKYHRRTGVVVVGVGLMVIAQLIATSAQAATSASSTENLQLSPGQLSVSTSSAGQLSGTVGSLAEGSYPSAVWSDTTGSGAGWQGSMAITDAVYTGSWTPQGTSPALGSTAGGSYTGTTDGLMVTVTVGSGATSSATPYTWVDNQNHSGFGTATNGKAAAIESGLIVDFASGTSYPSGAQYVVDAGAQSPSAVELVQSLGSVTSQFGVQSPAPHLVNAGVGILAGSDTAFGSSVPIVTAAQDTGMGSYTVSPGVAVTIDASSWAATYVSQAQYTIAVGPGSSTSTITDAYVQQTLVYSPTALWQLNDQGAVAIDASGNNNNGTYTGSLTQGVSGPLLVDSSVTATNFSGGWVTLPSGILQPTTETIEAWFKTTSSGGVLGMQNTTVGTTPTNYVPVIYVGSDGLLRAEVWQGQVAPITSSTAVNNGQWQFAALVVSPSSQSLYLNGQLVGTLGGTVQPSGMTYNQIGWAYTSGWTAGASGSDPFSGTIGQTAVFPSDLTQAQLSSQYTAAGY